MMLAFIKDIDECLLRPSTKYLIWQHKNILVMFYLV